MANDLQPLPTASAGWLLDSKPPSAAWLATRVETFLGHYWREGDDLTGEVVLSDWMACLRHYPRPAVEWACAEWLDRQPRYRPRPGDVADLCRQWVSRQSERGRREALRGEALTETQERVVQWAVDTFRLGRPDAVDAVRQMSTAALPDWLMKNDSEAQRCVFCVRNHPRHQEPADRPAKHRRTGA